MALIAPVGIAESGRALTKSKHSSSQQIRTKHVHVLGLLLFCQMYISIMIRPWGLIINVITSWIGSQSSFCCLWPTYMNGSAIYICLIWNKQIYHNQYNIIWIARSPVRHARKLSGVLCFIGYTLPCNNVELRTHWPQAIFSSVYTAMFHLSHAACCLYWADRII